MGFNYPTDKCYIPICEEPRTFGNCAETQNKVDNYYSCPNIPTALKWFRDVKNIKNTVCCFYYDRPQESWYGDFRHKGNYKSTKNFATYEEAESALLDELLELEI